LYLSSNDIPGAQPRRLNDPKGKKRMANFYQDIYPSSNNHEGFLNQINNNNSIRKDNYNSHDKSLNHKLVDNERNPTPKRYTEGDQVLKAT
jgi:hypothetical protein